MLHPLTAEQKHAEGACGGERCLALRLHNGFHGAMEPAGVEVKPVLETERLLLRPWRIEEAPIQRELWTERDPRVPAHRRIDADDRPSVGDLETGIRHGEAAAGLGLLAVERRLDGEVIGYCGLVENGPGSVGPGLEKLGFTETERRKLDDARGDQLVTTKVL